MHQILFFSRRFSGDPASAVLHKRIFGVWVDLKFGRGRFLRATSTPTRAKQKPRVPGTPATRAHVPVPDASLSHGVQVSARSLTRVRNGNLLRSGFFSAPQRLRGELI